MTLEIRTACTNDYERFARLFEELGTHEPPPNEAAFATMLPTTWMASRDADGAVAGYAFAQIFGESLYVRHLVAAPEARQKGVGRALMGHLRAFARARGATRWELNVKPDNVPAVRLYESLGMRGVYETRVVRATWARLDALGAAAGGATPAGPIARAPRETELEAVESAFRLPRGIAAKNASDPTLVLRAVFDSEPASAILGFASFNPSFPGVFPFRARDMTVAKLLLESLRPHARRIEDPKHPWRADGVQLVVEDADDVATALVAGGAEEMFRITHLEGPLGE